MHTASKRDEVTAHSQKDASAGNRTRGWPNLPRQMSCFEWQRPILPLNHQCYSMVTAPYRPIMMLALVRANHAKDEGD
jgi:hypothetical protein